MDKRTIRGNISIFDADIQAVKSQGLNYIFGETNSISCHGAPGGSCFKAIRSKWTQRVLTHVSFFYVPQQQACQIAPPPPSG
jgi:hypothetical protein